MSKNTPVSSSIQLELPFEEWRDIPGHEGIRQVSNLGRVRCLFNYWGNPINHIYYQKPNHFGYAVVNFVANGRRKTFRVHMIVMRVFVGERPLDKEVNHKDGNKMNASLANLEYVTRRENIRHMDEVLGKQVRGVLCHSAVLIEDDVREIRRLAKSGIGQRQIANRFGITQTNISAIVRRKTWKHVT